VRAARALEAQEESKSESYAWLGAFNEYPPHRLPLNSQMLPPKHDKIDKMNVIYLDQNVVINLAEKSERFGRAREAVLKQVETSNAVFPYSEVHFAESAAMPPESQRHVGKFFDLISAGYRFAEGKYIRSKQFKNLLEGRETSFRPKKTVFPDQISFAQNIDRFDPEALCPIGSTAESCGVLGEPTARRH